MTEPDTTSVEFKRSLQRDRKLMNLNREFKSIGFFSRGIKLNKREGIAGDVYLGFLRDKPVAIKMADDFISASETPYFYRERNFLLAQKIKPLEVPLSNLNFDAQIEFSELEREMMDSPFMPSEVMVSKFAPPISLEGDVDLPVSIHLATWLAWARMLDILTIDGHKYTMDSQPDDLRMSFQQRDGKYNLKIVKIDCVPVFRDDGAERDICWQIIDNMREMLGGSLPNHIKNMSSINTKPQRLVVLIDALEKGIQEAPKLSKNEIDKLLTASKRRINENGKWV